MSASATGFNPFASRPANTNRSASVVGHFASFTAGDGTVELVAEGDDGEIAAFLASIRTRFAGNIRGESTDRLPPTGEFTTFEVR